ncbi:hypothetical protein Daus18300_009954 [Diaporthe australafricana]|uniref:Alpha box domain-containing protein n=2 Tax=Diaporthe TaxID=36922 RepID=A0ABR3WCH5_9PEZI
MHPVPKSILGGAANIEAVLDKQRKAKHGGRGMKKTPTVRRVVKPRIVRYNWVNKKKKSVNAYIIYRACMSRNFPHATQAERSAYVRAMWEKELDKSAWILMAKVWTHIRDFSGGFLNMLQYADIAVAETGVVHPFRWLKTYHMVLVGARNGTVTLRQHHVPNAVPLMRPLTDVQLLFNVLKQGLPVKDPVELLDSLCRSQKHYIAFTTRKAIDEGKADRNFVMATSNNPPVAIAQMMGLAPNDNIFQKGVSLIDSERSTVYDGPLLSHPSSNTFGGFDFDTGTAHLALLSNGALDMSSMMDTAQVFDMGVPHQWDNFSGQISQHNHQTASNTTPGELPTYPLNDDFLTFAPGWDLQ